MRAWVLTDGNADDEARCLGVAEAVADRIERRVIVPRAPWGWLAPFGTIDPRDAPGATSGGPISPRKGWPEVAIAAGRRAVPYLRHVKRASNAQVITVLIGDTLAGPSVADIVAVTEGSRLTGPNVVRTTTRPHRVCAVRLAAARGGPRLAPDAPKGPRVGVLVGPPRRGRRSREDVERLAAALGRIRADGAAVLVSPRRDVAETLDMALGEIAHYIWDRTGPDPRVALIAQSDALVVFGDDLLAIDEAVATGRPVMALRPASLRGRDAAALDRLAALSVVRPFAGRIEDYAYAPLDSTPEIARAISALFTTRAALKPQAERRSAPRKTENHGPTAR